MTEPSIETPAAEPYAASEPPGDKPEERGADSPPSFADMNLAPDVQRALDEMGYEVPMEVQTVIYARVCQGRDLMVQSRTGSGKTAAFGIPLAQMLEPGAKGVRALILAPTRELALQISQEVGRICAYRNLDVVPVYGGAPMGRQIDALKAGAPVVAGTPGRVLDHIRRRTLVTDKISLLILDECDEMLSMGFQEEIEKILAEVPKERQTLLFSATIPEEIERIGRRHMREYDKIVLSAKFVGVHEIAHHYYLVSGLSRTRDLLKVLEIESPETAIIFCNTRDDTAIVAQFLQRHGLDAEAISGDLGQSDRERVMARMRDKNLRFLCATDIAARGIDISDLSHVINYTFPESPEIYIHRTGRTGRAGKSGTAVSLIGPREIGSFYYLKLIYKIKPMERELPSEDELKTRREGERFATIAAAFPEDPGDEWLSLARRVWYADGGERLLGALLRRFAEGAAMAPPTTEATASPASPSAEQAVPPSSRPPRPGESSRRGSRRRTEASDERRPRRRRERDVPGKAPEGTAPAQEFWEAWVEKKETPPATAPITAAPSPVAAAEEPRGRRLRPHLGAVEPGFVRLYMNVGGREGLSEAGVGQLIREAAPEQSGDIGAVSVHPSHTYFSVRQGAEDALMGKLTGKTVGERAIVIERAKR